MAMILKRTLTGCSLICNSTLLNWGILGRHRSAVMAKIIASLDEINFGVEDTKIDVLGNAYEYLIGQFAATAGKKAGEFYTPSGPAELLCRLACLGLTDVKDAADPTYGSGLLLRLKIMLLGAHPRRSGAVLTTYNLPEQYDPSWHSLPQFQYLQRGHLGT